MKKKVLFVVLCTKCLLFVHFCSVFISGVQRSEFSHVKHLKRITFVWLWSYLDNVGDCTRCSAKNVLINLQVGTTETTSTVSLPLG